MPIRDRKFYIAKHNGIVEDEVRKERGDSRIDGEMINKFTDYSQLSDVNRRNR